MSKRESPARKILNTGFFILQNSGYYLATDLISRVDAAALFVVNYNLYGDCELEPSFFKRYLKLRGLPVPENTNIVDERKSCFDNREGTVEIRAFSKKKWERKEYDTVEIKNLCLNSEEKKEKVASLKNLEVKCGCRISNFLRICRPPREKRLIFRDTRRPDEIPCPYVGSYIDTHASIALDWLADFYGTANFGVYGPTKNTLGVSELVIKDVVKYDLRLPKYRLNQLFEKLKFRMFSPLLEYARV